MDVLIILERAAKKQDPEPVKIGRNRRFLVSVNRSSFVPTLPNLVLQGRASICRRAVRHGCRRRELASNERVHRVALFDPLYESNGRSSNRRGSGLEWRTQIENPVLRVLHSNPRPLCLKTGGVRPHRPPNVSVRETKRSFAKSQRFHCESM